MKKTLTFILGILVMIGSLLTTKQFLIKDEGTMFIMGFTMGFAFVSSMLLIIIGFPEKWIKHSQKPTKGREK